MQKRKQTALTSEKPVMFLRPSHCVSLGSAELRRLSFNFDADIVEVELPLLWTVLADLQLLGLVCVSSE